MPLIRRPLLPSQGPGLRDLLPAVLIAAAGWSVGPLLLLSGLGATVSASTRWQATATFVAAFALSADLGWVRLHQRVPLTGRALVRLLLATIGMGWPAWAVTTAAALPIPLRLLVAGAFTAYHGFWVGEKEMRQRFTSTTTWARTSREADAVRRRVQRRACLTPDQSARRWLDLNLLATLAPLPGSAADPQQLLKGRALLLRLLTDSPDTLTRPQAHDLVALGLEIARGLEQIHLGAGHDTSGQLIDELVAFGRRWIVDEDPPPNTVRSRLAWVEAERKTGLLLDEVSTTDELTVLTHRAEFVARWRDVLTSAEESLHYACVEQVADATIGVATAAYHLARHDGSVEAWDAFLSQARELRDLARGDRTALRIVTTAENSAVLGRALAEEDDAARLEWLARAEAGLRHQISAPGEPDDAARDRTELGRVLVARFTVSRQPSDVEQGLEQLSRAVPDSRGFETRCAAALTWAGEAIGAVQALEEGLPPQPPTAPGDQSWDARWRRSAAEACSALVDTVLDATAAGALRAEYQGPARRLASWPILGAELFLEIGAAEEAVVLLERCRLLALTAALDGEGLDEALRGAGWSELAEQRAQLAAELDRLETIVDGRSPGVVSHATDAARSQAAEEAHQCRLRLTKITERAHAAVGWRTRAVDLATLQEAARTAPLLYVVAGYRSGYAVVVGECQAPSFTPLPEFTMFSLDDSEGPEADGLLGRVAAYRAAQDVTTDREARWRSCVADTIGWLRATVAEPLAEALDPLSRVAVVPCGHAAQLPVHAVLGERRDGGARVVHYAAAARTLRHRAEEVARRGVGPLSLLAVSVPESATGVGQPLTAANPLAQAAFEAFESRARTFLSDQSDPAARRSVIAAALPSHNVAHFSCHGVADAGNPLTGGLELADGRLTVGDVLRLRVPAGRLAVLSACEGGQSDRVVQDELNALATGMIEAGYAGVIAALWEVRDQAAYYLLRRFYDLWSRDLTASPAECFAQAQHWLRYATYADREIYPPPDRRSRLINPTPELLATRAFPNPDDWAAFAYHGI